MSGMSGWAIATWLAIVALGAGSMLVFGWFLAEVRAFLRRRGSR